MNSYFQKFDPQKMSIVVEEAQAIGLETVNIKTFFSCSCILFALVAIQDT